MFGLKLFHYLYQNQLQKSTNCDVINAPAVPRWLSCRPTCTITVHWPCVWLTCGCRSLVSCDCLWQERYSRLCWVARLYCLNSSYSKSYRLLLFINVMQPWMINWLDDAPYFMVCQVRAVHVHMSGQVRKVLLAREVVQCHMPGMQSTDNV